MPKSNNDLNVEQSYNDELKDEIEIETQVTGELCLQHP